MPNAKNPFQSTWSQFIRLNKTYDSLVQERRGLRRWMLLPHIAFVIPTEDQAVQDQLQAWQAALKAHFAYDPQPVNRLHITLHYVGMLRDSAWMLLPHTWQRGSLHWLADQPRRIIEGFSPFTLMIGPVNSFRNAAFAEVHDPDRCLRLLRAKVRRTLPLRARPPSEWHYMPHITLGYWGEQAAPPLVPLVEALRDAKPVPLRVESVKFTVYRRNIIPLERDFLSDAREDIIAEYRLRGSRYE